MKINKVKPCVNDMCILYDFTYCMNCKLHKQRNTSAAKGVEDIWTKVVLRCKKYLTEKPESIYKEIGEKVMKCRVSCSRKERRPYTIFCDTRNRKGA